MFSVGPSKHETGKATLPTQAVNLSHTFSPSHGITDGGYYQKHIGTQMGMYRAPSQSVTHT